MKALRVGLHSLMLLLADFAGVLAGFLAYKTLDFPQMTIQLPVAVAVSLLLFLLGSVLVPVFGGKPLRLSDLKELLLVFVFSIALALAVFVPLHFLTQGYLTASGNLVMLAFYQIPVNLIALCGVWILQN
jgi:hypothetical protein